MENSLRYGNVLGECPVSTVLIARYAQYLPIFAKIDFSSRAGTARAAIDCRINGDSFSVPRCVTSTAGFNHNTRDFVSHYDGWNSPSGFAGHPVHVAPADPNGADLDEHLLVPRRRCGNLLQLKLERCGMDQGFHGRLFMPSH